ncbi:uncharacterized protein LOC120207667 isoform X3 [Hibiscus syriacus]|uniref:uncharacterized protein LOC120207667 isoform X3 n=1 Tax=Hibiscus syriacus TaxID=106335 RepID=UPI001924B253|nr:uncharacterized protein LOC120207667 isoform X3 [Hibiscus syriacus]
MKLALLRNMSFLGCRFLQSSAKSNTFLPLPKQPSYFSLAALIRSQPRFYSTNGGGGDDDDDVSKEGSPMFKLKSLFNSPGILKRKLTGKHDESDDELMREICGDWKQPLDNAVDQEELDSDLSDSSDTDRD